MHRSSLARPVSVLAPCVAFAAQAALALAAHGPLPAQGPAAGLADLPRPRAARTLQFSSHDRTGANEDHSNYLRVEPNGTRVLAEATGPGRITRIWSANPSGRLRILLDTRIVFDAPFQQLFDGSISPFTAPLAGFYGGGATCMVPMPFLQSCKVEAPPGDGYYYQVGIEQRPEAEAFRIPPGPAVVADVEKLLAGARRRDEGQITRVLNRRVHASEVVAQLTGSGEVLELRFTPHAATPGAPADAWRRDARAVWVEVRADGEVDSCLQGPIADVFGMGPDGHDVQTQPCFGLGRSRCLALPMPFRTRLEVRLVRTAGSSVTNPPGFDFETVWAALPANHGRHYLHGAFRRQHNDHGEPFRVLDVAGSGHFAGAYFTFAGAAGQGFGYLEGDETITADDTVVARGTGTEDYLGGAWYFRTGTFCHPFFALCTLQQDAGIVASARWHVADPLPFTRSFRFDLEHGGHNDTPGSDYAVMAFWYQSVPTGRPVQANARRDALAPQGSPAPYSLEAEDLWPGFTVRDATTATQSAGAIARLPAGNHVAPGVVPPGEWMWTGLIGLAAVQPARLVRANDPRDVVLPVTGTGLDVDRIQLEPFLPSIREWRIVGPFAGGNRQGIDVVYGPERDWSPKREYPVLGTGPRGWLDLPGPISASGHINIDPVFGGRDDIVAYAFTNVISPFDQEGLLVLGSDDSVKVFWNGKPVFRHVVLRAAGRDQDRVPLVLKRGTNTLMLKLEDILGGFGFYARIEDARGLRFQPR